MGKRRRMNIISKVDQGPNSQVQQSEQQRPERSQPLENENLQQSYEVSASSSNRVQSENVHKKRVRGTTRMNDIWELDENNHVIVKVDDYNVPIYRESCILTRFIGTMVRMATYVPISFKSWHLMPNSKKEEMWNTIESKFVFHKYDSDELVNEEAIKEVKSWAMTDMATKWRQWKNHLKSEYFDEHKTLDEMTAKVFDRRVDKSQFRIIASHWLTDKSMEQSEQNRMNRSKLNDPHCTGTKSFPRIIHTMTKNANGVRPSRAEVYIHSRTCKDGTVVNEKAAEVVERMRMGFDENNSENDNQSWHEGVYSQVKGPEKKGRVQCMGSVSTSSLKSVHSSSQTQQKEKVEKLETEVSELKEVLGNVLTLLQRQFPNENVNVLTTAARLLNREVPDADSGPSSHPRNRSSACSHHLDENEADDAP